MLSRPILFVVLLSLCIISTLAQNKFAGTWKRDKCSCTADAPPGGTCDDIWLTSYDIEQQGIRFVGDGNGTHDINFTVDNAGQTTMVVNAPLPGYICEGVINKEIVCRFPNDTVTCTATFFCSEGDCITTIVQQNMRSIMYPVMAIIFGVVWFIWPLIGGLISPKVLAISTAGIIYVFSIFLIFLPPFYHAILLMAIGAFAFNAIKAGGPWEIKVAIFGAVFGFLTMIGLNVFAGLSGSVPYFDLVMTSFNQNSCYLVLGEFIDGPRCAQYALFAVFVGYLITLVLPLLVIALLWLLVQEENGK